MTVESSGDEKLKRLKIQTCNTAWLSQLRPAWSSALHTFPLSDGDVAALPPLHPSLLSAPVTAGAESWHWSLFTQMEGYKHFCVPGKGGGAPPHPSPHSCIPQPASEDIAEEGSEIAKDRMRGWSASRVLTC